MESGQIVMMLIVNVRSSRVDDGVLSQSSLTIGVHELNGCNTKSHRHKRQKREKGENRERETDG